MDKSKFFTATVLCAVLLIPMIANAALVSRLNGQALYDTELNITWLANANLAATESFGVSGITSSGTITGIMNLETANNWVTAMNNNGYLNITNWRLPTTAVSDNNCTTTQGVPITNNTGSNCSQSEMGHLFYNEFNGMAGQHIRDNTDTNISLFSFPLELGDAVGYWSGTQPTSTQAFVFGFNVGGQGIEGAENNFYKAFAVADGDVASLSSVPVPASVWLFSSGLIGIIGLARGEANA
ncbi:MAG: hypothetical protein QM479_05205 [Pseudomonadota bacterium]